MKVNTIVLLHHEGLLRIGVIFKRLTIQTLDQVTVNCIVRLPPTKAKPHNRVETWENLLTPYEPPDELLNDPIYSLVRRTDDLSSSISFVRDYAAKPTEDPDEIPF